MVIEFDRGNNHSENGPKPDIGGILVVDPEELLNDNPAGLIVNWERYHSIYNNFHHEAFQLPQVVRVKAYNPSHQEVVKYLVVDGNTRVKVCADKKGQEYTGDPSYQGDTKSYFNQIKVQDITQICLSDTDVVPENERVPGQNELTVLQYLRAVVPYTVVHSKIAPDRIAAHLINGWESMVGEELAQKFSALAALNFLANGDVSQATRKVLNVYVKSQEEEIMANETVEERDKLVEKLYEMTSLLNRAAVSREAVALQAFLLVSAKSPVIGGEQEARKQIYGLINLPEVNRKLAKKYPGEKLELAKTRIIELGNRLTAVFQRFSRQPNGSEIVEFITGALRDPEIGLEQLFQILDSATPIQSIREVKEQTHRDALMVYYLDAKGVARISDVEIRLIDQFGRKAVLTQSDLAGLAMSVEAVQKEVARVVVYQQQLAQRQENLVTRGVQSGLIEGLRDKLNSLQTGLLSVDSERKVNQAVLVIEQTIKEAERQFTDQVKTHDVTVLIDHVFGARLEGQGELFRRRLIDYLKGDRDKPNDETRINRLVARLDKLPNEYYERVVNGDITLEYAQVRMVRDQEEEKSIRAATLRQAAQTEPPVDQMANVVSKQDLTITTVQAQGLPGEQQGIDQAEQEKNRAIELESLITATRVYMELLDQLQYVNYANLPAEVIDRGRRMLKAAGFVFMGREDIVKMVRGAEEAGVEVQRLKNLLFQRNEQDTFRDTQTRI